MKEVHELLKCSPAKIYDLLIERFTGERVVRIDFLVKLLQERGQLPLNYYDNDSVSLEDKVRKHYGGKAVEAIKQNLNGTYAVAGGDEHTGKSIGGGAVHSVQCR